jgi:putative DNA primase/helicase
VGENCRVKLPNGRWSGTLKSQKKPHKLPINAHTGGLAASTRSATWTSLEDARLAVQKWSLTGVGFVFTESDPYSGVDIDNCRNSETGRIADWAWAIIRPLESYTEISPSGTGVHTIVRGKLPAGQGNQVVVQAGKVEMFSRTRYFTFTGIHVEGTPTDIFDRQVELLELHRELFGSRNSSAGNNSVLSSQLSESDDELIAKAKHAHNGSKFGRLWNRRWEGDYPSQSEADLALCCLLAFRTGKDRARIDGLFRRSGMMRKKWERKHYREDTISRAVARTDQTWAPAGFVGRNGNGMGLHSGTQEGVMRSAARGGARWEPPVPFHQFDLPRFPTEALPGWLRAFVEAEATATQTPVDLAGMLVLSVIGASCAKKVVVRIKEGYSSP